jgi:NADH dehydrogenase (ubiquinone) Fe-S protein 2
VLSLTRCSAQIVPPPRATMKESMEGLIAHFKQFSEGYK